MAKEIIVVDGGIGVDVDRSIGFQGENLKRGFGHMFYQEELSFPFLEFKIILPALLQHQDILDTFR